MALILYDIRKKDKKDTYFHEQKTKQEKLLWNFFQTLTLWSILIKQQVSDRVRESEEEIND